MVRSAVTDEQSSGSAVGTLGQGKRKNQAAGSQASSDQPASMLRLSDKSQHRFDSIFASRKQKESRREGGRRRQRGGREEEAGRRYNKYLNI